MVRPRSGRGSLGCLVTLLLATAFFYFAYPVGDAYWKDYRYRDRMQREAEFAHLRTDDEIRNRLALFADSLGLPDAASIVRVARSDRRIVIRARYVRTFDLPFVTRDIEFTPSADHLF